MTPSAIYDDSKASDRKPEAPDGAAGNVSELFYKKSTIEDGGEIQNIDDENNMSIE